MKAFAASEFPVLNLDEVWHLGTMDPELRGTNRAETLESHCLSVSTIPQIWEAILEMQGTPWWRLTRSGGTFLDFHAMDSDQRERVDQWGLKQKLVRRGKCFRIKAIIEGRDDEILHESLRDARESLSFYSMCARVREDCGEPTLEEFSGLRPTRKLIDHAGHHPSLALLPDVLATVFAEVELGLDGVWWSDEVRLDIGQAARGGIFPSRLSEWAIERISPRCPPTD